MINIRRLQDINLNEVMDRQKYYNANSVSEAKKIISQNPNLEYKVLNAENLNNLVDGILELEANSNNNIQGKLSENLNKFNINIDELVYLKEYDNNTEYFLNNFVLYNKNIYYCIKPSKNILPTNTEYWLYLGLQGQPSPKSLGVKYQGFWSSSKNYNKYDLVIYNDKMYVAKNSNINKTPLNDTTNWSLQMSIINQNMIVSKEEPKNLRNGNIWIHILS